MTTNDLVQVVADDDREPTLGELRAIEAEWPVIAAELAVVDAEIAVLQSPYGWCELDRRRLRRAQAELNRQIAADAARFTGPLGGVA
jgi:hypothetical protein